MPALYRLVYTVKEKEEPHLVDLAVTKIYLRTAHREIHTKSGWKEVLSAPLNLRRGINFRKSYTFTLKRSVIFPQLSALLVDVFVAISVPVVVGGRRGRAFDTRNLKQLEGALLLLRTPISQATRLGS